ILDAKAPLSRLEGQPVAGERRCDDGKRIRGIPAKARWVAQARDQLEELEDRARPSMQQQKRVWRRPLAGHLQEMNVDAVERYFVLREGIQPSFLGAPIEGGAPIFNNALQIGDLSPVGPRLAGGLVGKSRPGQPLAKIGDGLVGNSEGEGFRLR